MNKPSLAYPTSAHRVDGGLEVHDIDTTFKSKLKFVAFAAC